MKSDLEWRVLAWQKHRSAVEQEADRRNFLNKPLPPNMNSEAVTKPTRIRRIGRGFLVAGRAVQMGETVVVRAVDACELVYLKRAEYAK
jgi:hypothetical protein